MAGEICPPKPPFEIAFISDFFTLSSENSDSHLFGGILIQNKSTDIVEIHKKTNVRLFSASACSLRIEALLAALREMFSA